MDLYGIALGLVIGVCIWAVSRVVPFRRNDGQAQPGLDVLAAICGAIFGALLSPPLQAGVGWLAGFVDGWTAAIAATPLWLMLPAYLLAADCGAYWTHRLLHSRRLWSTHAFHHSPKRLNWLSGLRGSPVHILLVLVPYSLAVMLFPVPQTGRLGLVLMALYTVNQHLIHSNVRIPFARRVEYLLVTPRFHFAHHDRRPAIGNSNYGFIFTIWDRLFGTYTDPDTVDANAELGIAEENSPWRMLIGLPAPRHEARQRVDTGLDTPPAQKSA